MDNQALELVRDYILDHFGKIDKLPFFEVFIVWKCKSLQNQKYLIGCTLLDDMYYEMTFNGDKSEWYLDAYKKVDNCCIIV